jgi:hypothetical protein
LHFCCGIPGRNDSFSVIGVIFFSDLLNNPIKIEKNNGYCIEYAGVFFFGKSEKKIELFRYQIENWLSGALFSVEQSTERKLYEKAVFVFGADRVSHCSGVQ